MRRAILAGLVLMAGPAWGQEGVTLDRVLLFNTLRDRTNACYDAAIVKFDDARSDAKTIVGPVRAACRDLEVDEIAMTVNVSIEQGAHLLELRREQTDLRVTARILERRVKAR